MFELCRTLLINSAGMRNQKSSRFHVFPSVNYFSPSASWSVSVYLHEPVPPQYIKLPPSKRQTIDLIAEPWERLRRPPAERRRIM